MKVESCSFFDGFDIPITITYGVILDREFISMYEIADFVHKVLLNYPTAERCIVFVDNNRFLYITKEMYSVHYIGHFVKSNI